MNRILLLLVLSAAVLTAVSCGPEKIENVTPDWHDFSQVGRLFPVAPRPMFLYVSEADCDYCVRMDTGVFARPEIADYLNRHFYPVKLDIATDFPVTVRDSVMNEPEFRKLLSIQGIPALFFFEANGRIVGALDQSLDLLNFKRMLVYVQNGHYGKTPWEQWLQLPEADLDTVYGVF